MGSCVYLFLTTEKGRSTLGEERAESAKQLLRSSKPQVVREARAQGMTATVAVCERKRPQTCSGFATLRQARRRCGGACCS